MVKIVVLSIALSFALLPSLLAQDPPSGDFAELRIRGTFKVTSAKVGTSMRTVSSYTLSSEGREWRLVINTKDRPLERMLTWMAPRVNGQSVTVTGFLEPGDKADLISILRIEPIADEDGADPKKPPTKPGMTEDR